jgi:chromosome segregation ATPase
VTKVAKLSTGKDYGIKSETEVKEEPDPRDEKIALLEKKLKTLAKELEVMTNDRDEHRLRVCELEARETKRIEKEKLVETDMHSTMKLAGKKLEAQLKANALNEKKEFKAKCLARVDKANEEKETAIADLKAKHAEQTKRTVDGWKKKLQDSEERRKQDNADHKQEVKDLKEKHKEDIKSYKPDHSIAMKEKAKELRAKDKKIADLEQATKGIDALNAEKESLATKLEKQRDKTEKLQDLLDRLHQAKVDMEGAYNHKLEHEARRWKIQNDIAEGSKAKLMIQQRSNFALREECNVKNNRIQALQQQLHAPQRHNYISTEDTAVQSYIFTTDAAAQSHISTTDAYVQKSRM